MRLKIKTLTFAISLISLSSGQCWAMDLHQLTVSGYFGSTFYPAAFSSPQVSSSSGSMSVAPDLTIGYALTNDVSLEIALTYLTRRSTTNVAAPLTAPVPGTFNAVRNWTSHAITVPLMARYSFLNYFSAAAGPFVSAGVGHVSMDQSGSSFTPTGSSTPIAQSASDGSTQLSFTDNQQKSVDWGLGGSIKAGYPLAQSLDVVANFLYLKGLTEQSTNSTISLKSTDILFLLGLQYRL